MTGFPISGNPIALKATLGNPRRRSPAPDDIPDIPFSFPAFSTYVQSKFSAPSLCNDDDNGRVAGSVNERKRRGWMKRGIGKR